ncbi:MAG: type IV secretion system protein TraC [Sulfuricaulis sp.]
MSYVERQEALVRMFGVVHAFDEDQSLFTISPDRIGFGVICAPIAGMDVAMSESLNALLNIQFPKDTLMQFSMYASPDIEDVMHSFRVMRGNEQDPVLSEITRQRMAFLRDLTQRPIGQVSGARLRQLRLVITVQIKHGVEAPTNEQLYKIRELVQTFHSALKGVGFRFQVLNADRYKRFMETVLNHGPDAFWRQSPWSQAEKGQLLCNQLMDIDTDIDDVDKQLLLGDHTHVRVLSVKRYPDFVYAGMAARYMGDVMRGSKALRDPVLFTVNIIYPDHESLRAKISRDFAWAQKQTEGQLARFIPEYARKAESLTSAMEAINAGDRILYAYIGCAIFAESNDAAIQSSTEVAGMFRELGYQMMEDRYMLRTQFAQLMPFGAEADIRESLTRYRTLMSRHVVPMLPVVGTWRGTGTPLLTLIARDGQLMPFSPYDSDGNYNMVIAAQSGMGKSYLANNMTTNFLTLGGRSWIIDKGYSYKKMCEMQGGQYIEFTNETALCINPFGIVNNFTDEVDILSSLIAVMAAPKHGLDDFQSAAVTRVLTEQWNLKQHALQIDDLAAAFLAEDDERIKDIGNQLFAFTTKGQYGKYFNGVNNVNMDNRLVVLELQQLSGRPHLQRLVLLQLMYQIQQGMDRSPRDMPKLLLIDEAWNLLASKETQDFIIGWYRQLRKFGACAAICTQSVNDFYTNEGSIAIIENSAHLLLLGQKPESIAAVRRQGRLEMSEGEFKLLETVHTVPGEYSEIMVRNAFGTGVGRLVESPFNNLLYSSRAADVSAIESYLRQGLNLVDAINRVLADRGLASGAAVAPERKAA